MFFVVFLVACTLARPAQPCFFNRFINTFTDVGNNIKNEVENAAKDVQGAYERFAQSNGRDITVS